MKIGKEKNEPTTQQPVVKWIFLEEKRRGEKDDVEAEIHNIYRVVKTIQH